VAAALSPDGHVALVGRNANLPHTVPDAARELAPGLFVRSAGPRARFVYGVRDGRLRFRAVGTRAATKNATVLRRYVKGAKLL
jgi:hypothetical protein